MSLAYEQSISESFADLQTMPLLGMLSVHGTPLDDTHIDALGKMTTLNRLTIKETKLTEAGVQRLHQALPNCTIQSDFGVFGPKQ